MFALPPPPSRYPNGQPIVAVPEARNVVEHPTGPQYQLQLSEGIYVLRDDLVLGGIPPHPSEPIVLSTNVLDNKPVPPTAGTRLSLAILEPRNSPSRLRRIPTTNSFHTSIPEHPQEPQGNLNPFSAFGMGAFRARFGDGNTGLRGSKNMPDPSKPKKPKNNMTKSSSSFVSRVIPHEGTLKRLQEHPPDGAFAIVNINRAVHWMDLSSPNKAEQLTKILFAKAHALCHDFNNFTKSPTHLDMVLGFSTSDLIWYEPMSQKYARLNKNGIINPTPISELKWLPESENLFVAAHFDGTLVVYDKEREDAPFVPDEPSSSPPRMSSDGKRVPRILVKKSIQTPSEKTNPVAAWKVSNQRINGIDFSPDGTLLAIVSEDGALRIYDYMKEELLDLYSSYYGGLTCVCWSPDGMYIVTGGQDDLVSIWSTVDRSLVARCVGHHSWVTGVAFDPWRCDGKTYRFGSVGDDCRLLLWDFSVGMLHRPRAASIRQSISSFVPLGLERTTSAATMTRITSNNRRGQDGTADEDEVNHPALPRSRVATLPPVLSKEIDEHPLSWLTFEDDCIITACSKGHIRTWDRPKEDAVADDEPGLAAANPFRTD